jgi:signal transduction histidine kinase
MPARTALGFVAAVAAIVLGVVVYFAVVADRNERAAQVTARSETVVLLQELADALGRAESAQRGYLLTQEERHLEEYREAIARIPPALERVKARTSAGAWHGRHGEALHALIEAKLEELKRGVEVREASGLARTLRELRAGDGQWLTEAIEAVRAEMEAVERADLSEEWRAWSGRIALADAVFVGANLLLLALVVAAAVGVRAEMARREARERERAELLELQERILGIVSHDLRNPLSAIQTGATLLARAELPEPHAHVVGLVRSSARRMERIIADLLDYTRIRAKGGIPLALRPADLGEVCARVVDEVALSAPDHAVELHREGDLGGEWDAERLQQAIGNLVANAIRHAAGGAPVRVRAVDEGDAVRLDVENDGPPIEPELMRSLFDPFQQGAHAVSRGDGLGLGLSIVRSIVEAHGGTVAVRSGASRPVTFTASLPRDRSSSRRNTASTLWRPTGPAAPKAGAQG